MKIGGLFEGYGGLSQAVKEVWPDAELAWVSEFDKGPSKVLAHRFPDVPNLGDITKIDWTQVPPVDVITGGSPCQDLSHAGARRGMNDGTRSNLWVSMREAIATVRPRLVVWENVRGAYSAQADSAVEPCAGCVGDGSGNVLRALGRVLGDLSELGYDAAWCGLRAADVGAAHGRFRVFVLAWDAAADADNAGLGRVGRFLNVERDADGCGGADGLREAGEPASRVKVLPTPTTRDHKDHTSRREPHRPDGTNTLARALTDVPCALLPTPAVNDMGEGKTVDHWDEWTAKMQAKHGNGNGHGKSLAIEAQRLLPTPRATDGTKGGPNQRGSKGDLMLPSAINLLPTPAAQDPGYVGPLVDGEGNPATHITQRVYDPKTGRMVQTGLTQALPFLTDTWGDYAAAIQRWEHVTGRPAPEPTQMSAKGNPQLSARFAEWLMGAPDGWITDVPGVTRNEALKMAGNGVVWQQGAAALRWMLAQIEDAP